MTPSNKKWVAGKAVLAEILPRRSFARLASTPQSELGLHDHIPMREIRFGWLIWKEFVRMHAENSKRNQEFQIPTNIF